MVLVKKNQCSEKKCDITEQNITQDHSKSFTFKSSWIVSLISSGSDERSWPEDFSINDRSIVMHPVAFYICKTRYINFYAKCLDSAHRR